MITNWSTLGLGAWVDDWNLTDGATTLEFNDFEAPLDDSWQIGPRPEGTITPVDGWNRRGQEFIEGGVVTTDDTVYTGFGFEGVNESARVAFLQRTLAHLGIGDPPDPGGRQGTASPAAPDARSVVAKGRAYAKLKGTSLKGKRVRVRIAIEGDSGATVAGRVRLARGRAAYGKAAFKGAAGQVLSVDVRLNRAARKALAGSGTLNATLRASGADSGGTAVNARQRVTLARR